MTPAEIRSAALPSTNGEMLNRVQQLRLDNTTAGAKQSRGGGASWLPWVLALFLAITWAGIGIKEYKGAGNIRKSLNTGAAPAATGTGSSANSSTSTGNSGNNSAAPVAAGTVVVAQKGVLIPTQQIAVSPIDVGGRVVELNVIEGKAFKKGDVLARLEDINYRAQVAESVASLTAAQKRYEATKQRLAELDPKSVRKIEIDQAKAQLDEAKAQQVRTRDELERLNTVTRTGGALSTRELQQAEADLQQANARVLQMQSALSILTEGPRKEKLLAAEADMDVAEADVRGAEARLTQSRWRLDNCVIRAPIDGVVLRKIAELGNLVNPMAFSASTSGGGSICDIANLADMEVDMDIPERDIEKVYPGQQAKVIPDAFKNREYKAVVDRIMPIADDSKSVIKIRVKVFLPPGEVPGTYLKPRMSVNASLIAGEPKSEVKK
jgi:HlyD family secretion protein